MLKSVYLIICILLLTGIVSVISLAGPPPVKEPQVPPIPLVTPDIPAAAAPDLVPVPQKDAPPPKGIKLPGRNRKQVASRKGMKDKDVIQNQVKRALQLPVNSMSVESKTIYSYVPDAIYMVYAARFHVVDIQLQPGEKLNGHVVAGDTYRWEIGQVEEGSGANTTVHVLLKPKQENIETNFLISTTRHAYRLYAQSQDDFFIPTVGWAYPEEEMDKAIHIKKEQQRLDGMVAAPAIIAANLNFKYKIKADGRYAWTPLRAFDDGNKTYIQMSPEMKNYEAPAFFIKEEKKLNLVNYRIRKDYFIVDRLFNEGELRCGKKDRVRIIRESSWFSINGPYFESSKNVGSAELLPYPACSCHSSQTKRSM